MTLHVSQSKQNPEQSTPKKNEIKKLFYQNDQVFFEGEINKDGFICGKKMKFYYPYKTKVIMLRIDADDSYSNQTIMNAAGKYKEYYTTGEIKFEGHLHDGLKNGPGKEYYKNGVVRYEGNFKKGGYNGEKVSIKLSTDNFMLENANFVNGFIRGKVYNDKIMYNQSNHVIYRPYFCKNGILDTVTEGTQKTVYHRNPTRQYYYHGDFLNGQRHGEGKYKHYNGATIYEGLWEHNLPVKSVDTNYTNFPIIFHTHEGNKVFEGNIFRDNKGWLYGHCKLFMFLEESKILYDGNYRAPTLEAVILQTFDLELLEYEPFLPKTNFLNR